MSSENQSQYLKTPHVLKIINKDGIACEEKLDELRNLIGGKGLKVLPSGEELPEKTPEVPVVSNSLPAPTATQSAIEKIVSEISGVKEKQLARSLLNEIDRSDYISFDPDNLEIIVDGENIKFSNIKNLVQYCISANPSHLPLAIALFLQCMIRIKIPSELLRHGDALGIRESLLKIEELKSRGLSRGENTPHSEPVLEGDRAANGEGVNGVGEQGERGKKRDREEDDKDDGGASVLNPAKKSYGISQGSLDKIRTAPKLREQISSTWRDAMGGGNSRKRKATLEYPEAEAEKYSEWNNAAEPASRSKRKRVTLEYPGAEEETYNEWNEPANPASRSKRKRVTVDFVPEEEEEFGRGKRKRTG